MRITSAIVDFDVDLLLTDFLFTSVDIQNGRLILIVEYVVHVAVDQASLTDCSVSGQAELQELFTL